MSTRSGGVRQWTERFAIASALSMVALQAALLFDASYRLLALVGLFGAVLPMVFGMAYLLFPSYLGRTLSTQRLPGIHFFLTYAGTGLLVGHELLDSRAALLPVGALSWSLGVAVFVGALLRPVAFAIAADPSVVLPSEVDGQRSTRLATAMLPVAVGYLVVGTVALLSTVFGFPAPGGTFPSVVHLYGAGFAALLIFALGMRLTAGFFHVTPPTEVSWLVLACGGVAPFLLATSFWRPPWFLVGAGLEVLAMLGYATLIGVVASRTDRRRVGLYGVGLGALGGLTAVAVALGVVVGVVDFDAIAVHVALVLTGFLVPTIVGYAYLFFPVTTGQFRGATESAALATIAALGFGALVRVLGVVTGFALLRSAGTGLALLGTVGYVYLLGRRLLG
jgi:hypothetical protein